MGRYDVACNEFERRARAGESVVLTRASRGAGYVVAEWSPRAARSAIRASRGLVGLYLDALEAPPQADPWHECKECARCIFFRALDAAPWGLRRDGWRISRQSIHIGGVDQTTSLIAPGGAVVASCQTPTRDRRIWTLKAAREARAALAAERRAGQVAYDASLRAAAAKLIEGAYLEYEGGQEGGRARSFGGQWVSARGALRAAGLSPERIWGELDSRRCTLSLSGLSDDEEIALQREADLDADYRVRASRGSEKSTGLPLRARYRARIVLS